MVGVLDPNHLKDEPQELQKIFKTLFSQGKSLRSKLIHIVGSHLSLSEKPLLLLCRITEYIHNSSLLHDDLLDQSAERRNQPAAWLEFSPEQAVLAGDYLLAQVNIYLAEEGSLSLINLTAKTIKDLVKGEFIQRELIKIQHEDIKKVNIVSDLKTASLFKLCLISPFLLTRKDQDFNLESSLNSIGYKLGLLFQRSDDLLDFSIRNKEKKPTLIDLSQNYLNSFSCFLLFDKNETIKNKFRKIKNLEEIRILIKDFDEKLKDFDAINEKLIKETEEEIKLLKTILLPKEKELIVDLKKIPEYFYYRDHLEIQ